MSENQDKRSERIEAAKRNALAARDHKGRPIFYFDDEGNLCRHDYSRKLGKFATYATMPLWLPFAILYTFITEREYFIAMVRDGFKELRINFQERNFSEEEKQISAEARYQKWLDTQDEVYQKAMRS